MVNLRELCKRINIRHALRFDEPIADHTSFGIGGPADAFAYPESLEELKSLLAFAFNEHVPYFILGSGSNILVSDEGMEGLVIGLSNFSGIEAAGTAITAKSGSLVSSVSEAALANSLAGMEFIYSMPGTVGGAIWMNARCYGVSISEVLENVTYLDENCRIASMGVDPGAFDYKVSPFQSMKAVILEGKFSLRRGNAHRIRGLMETRKRDREKKGHFSAPSAGSVFKNNRAFGGATGEIIDSLGLRGFAIGGAKISPLHANIIINEGNATALDVLKLIEYVENRVLEAFGFALEREIILVGRW